MSDPNLTIDDLNALPERMRAHAAAKAVGMTSKEFLAAMSGIGVEIKSAQSGVTRQVLLTWFEGREQGAGAAQPAAATAPAAEAPAEAKAPAAEAPAEAKALAKKAPAKKAPAAKAAPAKAPAKKAPARKAARSQAPADQTAADAPDTGPAADTAPAAAETDAANSTADRAAADQAAATEAAAKKTPARKRTPRKTAAQRAAETAAADELAAGNSGDQGAGAASAPAASRSQSRPELPEIAIVTGEVGSAEPGNRRRRSTASPSFSPLFLSPDATPDTPTRDTPARDTPARDTPARDTAATGTRASADDASTDTSVEDTDHDEDHREDDQQGQGEGGSRRRRRGRRGRGRGRGEGGDDQNADSSENDDADDDTGAATTDRDSATGSDDSGSTDRDSSSGDAPGASDDSDDRSDSDDGSSDDESDGSDSGPSGSRRRRRRRRRSGGSGSGSDDTQATGDDPPHTEIHERDPRRRPARGGQGSGAGTSTSVDEVQGITGSTRLEAKRQRRRDGREAGRRRQPILSESEFLARRESVDRVMVVREKTRVDGKGLMTQVGVLEDKVLVEHFVTTESARSMVGNVYLGRVQNVLPSMEAAFVDIGRGRNGVLYAGEVNWEAAGLGGKARRIEQALKPGDMVLVQVTKDPIGQKGARLSTQISLAGRFLVYVPDGNSAGISRKLPDTERRRLKAILKDVVPEGSGVIIRTAAEGVSEEEIGRDVERLASQWTEISEAAAKRTGSGAGTPVALYEEPDLLVKVVRDLFNEDFSKLVIQGETSWNTVHDYVARVAPEMVERLERYDNPEVDVFVTHRVDEQLAKALERKVWLPSGGSLVIDRTEAMTVVDVNTGKYTGSGGNLEETVTKNNLEAAEEIVRQLRLRDVGGMVIIDFIDMVLEANRDLVLRRLTEALGRDRTRHQVSEVTSLGLVQLTRKKLGTGLVEAFSTPCEHCHGRGLIVHADPVHTESHNADEPGSRRGGRRRGGKSGDSSSSATESAAAKQAPRKDGPAPAAHPAVLAMGRPSSDEDGKRSEVTEGGESTPDTTTTKTAPAAPEAPAGSTVRTAEPEAAPDSTVGTAEPEAAPDSTVGTAEPEAAPAAPAGSGDEAVAESADAAGTTRPTRRRRATRRAPSTAPAPAAAAESTAAAEVAETPQAESDAVAEAATAVEEVAAARGGAADDAAGTTGQSTRRPRRRSSRREAGAAVADAAPPAAPEAPAVKVEAAPLAEAPTTVVAEPRTRPARRRATRSTTAPGSD